MRRPQSPTQAHFGGAKLRTTARLEANALMNHGDEKKPGPRGPGLDSAPCVKGRRASYLEVMVLVCEPPRTGELENTLTVVGDTDHVAVSVGSFAPPWVPTTSYR